MKKILIIVFVSVLVGGCAYFPSAANKPIIKVSMSPSDNKFEGIATQADRRLVITREREGDNTSQNGIPTICAEPFPDGAAFFSKLDKLNIEINGQTLGKESGEIRDVTIPFELHPALKFYRDGVFALCQAAMNGWVRVEPQLIIHKAGDLDNAAQSNKTVSGKGDYDTVSFVKIFDHYAENYTFKSMQDKIDRTEDLIKLLETPEYTKPPFLSEFETQLRQLRETAQAMYIYDAVARRDAAKALQQQAAAAIAQQKTEQARIQLELDKLKGPGGCNIACCNIKCCEKCPD